MTAQADAVGVPRVPVFKRRWVKVVASLLGLAIIAIVLLGVFAPSIAGSFAPGIIEGAAKDSVSGSVKVSGVSLSWGGPQLIGPVYLKDPSGATVATVTARASAGLWALATSGFKGDLGTLTLGGKVDLIKNADGSTNLQKAIAPNITKVQAGGTPAASASKSASSLPNVKAAVELTGIDITYKELDAAGKTTNSASITNLKGQADLATAGGLNAKAKLDAGVKGNAGTGGTFAIDATVDNLTDANGNPTLDKAKFDATVDATKLPVALLDALANLGGVLNEALGKELAVKIKAKGTMAQGDAQIALNSANVNTDLSVAMANSRITAASPGSLKIGSTNFINSAAFSTRFPQLKDALAKAGMTVASWPMIEAQVTKLNLPVPGAGGVKDLDLRAAAFEMELNTGGLSGTLAAQTAAQPSGGAAAAPAAPQPFAVAPLKVSIKAADLAAGATITADTSATLNGQSAGIIRADVQAKDLLDKNGRLGALAGNIGNITADLSAKGVSTALAKPFLGDAPLDPATDIGPTIDITAKAVTKVDQATAGSAPVDADLVIVSSNINATVPVRLADSTLTSRGEIKVNVASSAAIVQRILAKNAKPGEPPAMAVGGAGSVVLSVSDLSVPMKNGLDYAALAGKIRTDLRTVQATLPGKDGKPPAAPIVIDSVGALVTLAKGQPAAVDLDGKMSHEGKPFTLAGNVTLPGLMETLASKTTSPTAMIPGMEKLRVLGQVSLTGVPATLSKLGGLPAARVAGDPATGMDVGAVVDALLKDVVGQGIDVVTKFGGPTGQAQTVDSTVKAAAMNMALGMDLSSNELKLRQFTADATLKPETARRIADASGAPKEQTAGVNMRGPATFLLAAEPVTIPITTANGKIEAQTGNIAQPIKLALSLREPLIVSGLPLSKDQVINGGISGLQITVTAPAGALMDPKSVAPVNFTTDGQLVLDDGKPVATLAVKGGYVLSSKAVDVTAGLRQVNTAGVDRLLGKPNFLAGALGDSADINLTAKGPADNLNLAASVVSPRLKGADLAVKTDAEKITVTSASGGVAKIDWTIDPAFAATYLLAAKDEQGNAKPATMRLTSATPVTLELRSLVLAQSKPKSTPFANDNTGPLKPGTFSADLAVTIAKLPLEVDQPAQPAANGQPAKPAARVPVSLDGVTASIKTGANNTLAVNARINTVATTAATSTQPVTADISIAGFADQYGRAFDQDHAKVNADLKADRFPTAVVDGLGKQDGQLVKLLGDQIDLAINAKDAVLKGNGELGIDIRAKRTGTNTDVATVRFNAPIVPGQYATTLGTLDLSQSKSPPALEVKLYDYKYEVDTDLLKIFPLFASVSKAQATSGAVPPAPAGGAPPVGPAGPAGPGPATGRVNGKSTPPAPAPGSPQNAPSQNAGLGPSTITSTNLRLPIPESGGANRLGEFAGDIDVDLGRIDYTFKKDFGQFLDSTIFTKTADQKPISKFAVHIENGIVSYDAFEIPVRQFAIKTKGTVNLNTRQINMTVFVPTVAMAPGVMDRLNKSAGGILRDLAPGLITEATMVPIGIKGSLDNPTYTLDAEAFIKNLGDQITKQPGNLIDGIGNLLGGDKNKKKDKK